VEKLKKRGKKRLREIPILPSNNYEKGGKNMGNRASSREKKEEKGV